MFLMNRLRLWVLGRKATEAKCDSHHVTSRVHDPHMAHHGYANLDYLI